MLGLEAGLYAAETEKLSQTNRRRLEAFEMWIWRRMEKISWLDKVTNGEVSGELMKTGKYCSNSCADDSV